jgi:SAM-dependent methyltransferase
MAQPWNRDAVLELGRTYQPAAILAAAADLELFDALAPKAQTAAELARTIQTDLRGTILLLDALVALGLLTKRRGHYAVPAKLAGYLAKDGPQTVLGMAQHQANCLRRWAQLARVVKTGQPAERAASVRGEAGDLEAFITAMHNISGPLAPKIIRAIRPLRFRHLLDLGGGSGTWTLAFLRACPAATATLFDLPDVIPMAQRRLAQAKLLSRVRLVAGDFYVDPLPPGADLAWVSAIVHQNSRAENRLLFAKIFAALAPGGRLAIRDLLMGPDRTDPVVGALFAINMLVSTPGGGTFTFEELAEDLAAAGFARPKIARREPGMNCVLTAEKGPGEWLMVDG